MPGRRGHRLVGRDLDGRKVSRDLPGGPLVEAFEPSFRSPAPAVIGRSPRLEFPCDGSNTWGILIHDVPSAVDERES